jgi:hypothetical protein
MTIPQQLDLIPGLHFTQVAEVVAAVTTLFVLRAMNPDNHVEAEPEPAVWDHPGFTQETEILHGRIAMLTFAYIVIVEACI